MIIKVFLNNHGLNEIQLGGTVAATNKAIDAFANEVWIDSHEQKVTPRGHADGSGLTYYEIAPRIRESYPQQAAQQEAKQPVAPKVEVKAQLVKE